MQRRCLFQGVDQNNSLAAGHQAPSQVYTGNTIQLLRIEITSTSAEKFQSRLVRFMSIEQCAGTWASLCLIDRILRFFNNRPWLKCSRELERFKGFRKMVARKSHAPEAGAKNAVNAEHDCWQTIIRLKVNTK